MGGVSRATRSRASALGNAPPHTQTNPHCSQSCYQQAIQEHLPPHTQAPTLRPSHPLPPPPTTLPPCRTSSPLPPHLLYMVPLTSVTLSGSSAYALLRVQSMPQ